MKQDTYTKIEGKLVFENYSKLIGIYEEKQCKRINIYKYKKLFLEDREIITLEDIGMERYEDVNRSKTPLKYLGSSK